MMAKSKSTRVAHCLLLSSVALLASPAAAYTPTPHGAIVVVSGGGAPFVVELAVEGVGSFRLSVINASSGTPSQISTSMVVDKASYAPHAVAQNGNVVNLTAAGVGSISIDATSGAFALAGPDGAIVATSARLLTPASGKTPALRRDTCANPYVGYDAASPTRSAKFPNGAKVSSQADCCALCNGDSGCSAWVYDTQADNPNCWPLEDAGGLSPGVANRVLGAPPPPPALAFAFATSAGATFLGSGTDGPAAQTMERTKAQAQVYNTGSWTPSFWCSDGWSMLAVSPRVDAGDGVHGTGTYPVSWASSAGSVSINVGGSSSADLYLTPAKDLKAHVVAQAALEGNAALLPLYAMGFWACRWGWVDQPCTFVEGPLPNSTLT